MSTHNICFRREIRKTLCGYPLLSVAMHLQKAKAQVTLSESEFLLYTIFARTRTAR